MAEQLLVTFGCRGDHVPAYARGRSAHLRRQFAELAWKARSQASRGAIAIHQLFVTRDLLLSRLMSAELAI